MSLCSEQRQKNFSEETHLLFLVFETSRIITLAAGTKAKNVTLYGIISEQ